MNRRNLPKRTWRYGPRFTLARGPGQIAGQVAWWIWDNAEGVYVAGPVSEGRARVQVRTRNEAAGFGAVVNRVPPPQQPVELPRVLSRTDSRPGHEVTLTILQVVAVHGSDRAAMVVVRRAKRKRSVPPLATKVAISAPGAEPLEAVVMRTALGGPDEVVLTLEGVSAEEVSEGAELRW